MRAGLGDALHVTTSRASRRNVVMSLLLVLVVVVAAGTDGKIHFAGARWSPNFKSTTHKLAPPNPHVRKPRTAKTRTSKVALDNTPVTVAEIVLGVLVLIAIAWVIWRTWRRRWTPATAPLSLSGAQAIRPLTEVPEPDPPKLLTGIEAALRVLDEQRDPADAVVRAWLGLQETAEESGIARRPSETPTEFTARIMRSAFTDDQAIQTLLRLYLMTRFGDHPVTEAEVTEVRGALSEMVRTWQTPADPATTGHTRELR